MAASWIELLRAIDPDRFAETLSVRRRPPPVPPGPQPPDFTTGEQALQAASAVPLALVSAALADTPHACAVIDAEGYVIAVRSTGSSAGDRGWVPRARLYGELMLRETVDFTHPLVTVAEGGEDLVLPIATPDVPAFGAIVLACNPAQVSGAAVAALLQGAIATALAMQVAETRTQNEHLVGSIGHELRQPLSALVAALEIANRAAPQTAAKALEAAQRQSRRMVELVDALLDASRVATGKLQLVRRLLDMRMVVDEAVEAMHPEISRRQQHLRVHVPERAVWCVGDQARLRQVVVNLLSNASRFTAADGNITVSLSSEVDTVILMVADTGEGFDGEVRERIFRPFAQETNSQGLGLGLAISRAIAELHDGALVAESSGRGKGSIFVLQLPGVLERTREIRAAVSRTREETHQLIERARVLRTAHEQLSALRQR